MQTSLGRHALAYAVSALCATALLSACGSEEGGSGSSPSTPSTPSTPSDSPSASASVGMPPSGRARPVVMAGRVTSTDGGCTVFKSDRDARRWVLVGETKGLVAGTAYRLQGVAMDSMDPACPQGMPFHVNDAELVPFEPGQPLPPSTPPGEAVTLTGVVAAGVEAGCRVLRTDEGTFLLLGTVAYPDGTRVTVKGTSRDNVMSTCQQGRPVEVHSVTKAG